MPRETIARGNFQLEVGWSPDCDVQLGLRTSHSDKTSSHLVTQLYGHKAREIGAAVEKAVQTAANNDVLGERLLTAMKTMNPEFDSLWTDLDRHEINKLIKVLRRARDSAYGRDE